MVVICIVVIDAFKDDDLAGWEYGDDVDDDDGEELHDAADGHQIPLWVISILSLLRLYPQSGMSWWLSPLNILSCSDISLNLEF